MSEPRSVQPLSKTLGEAPAVGVVADDTFAFEDNGIHRADGRGIFGQAIERRDHAFLKGVRDV